VEPDARVVIDNRIPTRDLAELPEETRVYPGHDYGSTATTSIGRELLENRYLRCATLEELRALRG